MRLIDAEPLVAISWKAHKDETYERGFEDGVCHALDRIEQAPTIDAVPVVRCKDCRHYAIYQLKGDYTPDRRYNPSVCLRGEFARSHSPDWYCADGERRKNDG